jgi:hypothetical protein
MASGDEALGSGRLGGSPATTRGSATRKSQCAERGCRQRPPGRSAPDHDHPPTPAVKFASNTSWYAGGTRWLVFHYANTTQEAEWVDRRWRAAIITTAYRRLADERDLALVGGWTAREPGKWPDSHGISRWILARAGEPMTDAHELVQALTEGQSDNLRLVSIELLRAHDLAPIVRLQTDDPWRLVHGDSNEMAKFFPGEGTTRFEGALIRILGPTGKVVWTRGTANWAGTAVTWWVPELKIPT